jgi:hypothetical protein
MKPIWERTRWRITVERGLLRAEARRRRKVVWTGERAYQQETDVAEALASLIAGADGTSLAGTAEIVIAPPLFQRRTLGDLPPVSRTALRALVAHQASRFFRQNGHSLVTDAAWASATRGQPRTALAVAADEAFLTAVLEGTDRAGLRVKRVRPDDSNVQVRLSLLPATAEAAQERRIRREIVQLAWVVAALWVGVAAGAFLRFDRERRRVDAELTRLAAPLAALLTARREMGKAQAMLDAVASSTVDRLKLPLMVRAVTQSLPDSAFLSSLTLDINGVGSLSGAARRPREVVARLEHTPGVASPGLQGGTVLEEIENAPWERFTIGFGKEVRP